MSDPAVMLPIVDIQQLATAANLAEVQLNKNARVIAFRTPDEVRINVYYTTGTVGTYLDHPRMGRTQLFRRNVSLELLGQIFQNPRVHTDLGYHWKSEEISRVAGALADRGSPPKPRERSRTPRRGPSGSTTASSEDTADAADEVEEEVAARAQLAKLKEEEAHVQREIVAVQGVLDAFEAKRAEEKRKAEEEEERKREEVAAKAAEEAKEKADAAEVEAACLALSKLETDRRLRGSSFAWGGISDSDYVWENIACKEATCVAVCGTAALGIMENGSYAYTSGLPTRIHNKLHSRPVHASKPVYCAMGSQGRYYIRFSNGKSEIVASESCVEAVHKPPGGREVKSVAFGEDWESYFVVYTDGWWDYSHVPDALAAKIKARNSAADLDLVTLGPAGEWFLKAKNGRTWWSGIDLREYQHIRSVFFGDSSSYILRYSS